MGPPSGLFRYRRRRIEEFEGAFADLAGAIAFVLHVATRPTPNENRAALEVEFDSLFEDLREQRPNIARP